MGPATILLLLVLALAFLNRELRAYHYRQIADAVLAVSWHRIEFALAFTALAYAILPGYDALALRYAGARLPLSRTAFSSALAYGLSHTLGFPLVTSGALRYRFWSAWGLPADAIARAVSFVGATFTVGVVAISGFALMFEPKATLAAIGLPSFLCRVAGAMLLVAVVGYLVWSVVRQEPIRIRVWVMPVPSPKLAMAQVAVGVADWAAAGAVLYVLLPERANIGFVAFLGVFVLAQFAGLVSHVPGGIGVFETLMVVLLRPHLPADQTLAALVAYRVIYYLVPFGLALLALGIYEMRAGRTALAYAATSTAGFVSRWVPAILPQVLSVTTFIGGAILLLSGATPSAHGRVRALDAVLPLGVFELSHFTASVAGAGLVVLAWAIGRRIDAAWGLSIALLGIGIVTSILKGLDYEEALLLGIVLAALLPARRVFFRKAALTSEPLSPEWIVAMCVIIATSVWVVFFSYKHVEYDADLWWRFAANADAPRSLRAMAGAVGALFIFGLMRLLRHAEARPPRPSEDDLARARRIVSRSHQTWTNLALLGDKALLFSQRGDAFLMYGVSGRSWVALGDPVGPLEIRADLAWRFREEADRHGGWTVFYQATTDNLPIYIDLGLTLLKIGEEAIVSLTSFSLDGSSRRNLRTTRNQVMRSGASVEVIPAEGVPALLPRMRQISDAWLTAKSTREKGFSLGYFDERYLKNFPVAVVRVGGEVVAFANLLLGPEGSEVSADLMRYTPDAPRSIMEYLFIELLLWGKASGYQRFTLGMAPLSGLEARALAPLWSRAGAFLYMHGEHFYNFKGLRLFKNKFDPIWHPRYLASPGGLILPRVLANVASLISGGLRGVVAK